MVHIFSLLIFGLSDYLHLYFDENELFFLQVLEYFLSMPGEWPLFCYNLSLSEWSTTIACLLLAGLRWLVVSVLVFKVLFNWSMLNDCLSLSKRSLFLSSYLISFAYFSIFSESAVEDDKELRELGLTLDLFTTLLFKVLLF